MDKNRSQRDVIAISRFGRATPSLREEGSMSLKTKADQFSGPTANPWEEEYLEMDPNFSCNPLRDFLGSV
jgi:hypothetical protein